MTKILWFTGLSGVGKSTLSKILGIKLTKLSFKVKIIDGDIFRTKNKNKNLIGYNSNIKYEVSKYKKIIIDKDKLTKFKSINLIIKKIF